MFALQFLTDVICDDSYLWFFKLFTLLWNFHEIKTLQDFFELTVLLL